MPTVRKRRWYTLSRTLRPCRHTYGDDDTGSENVRLGRPPGPIFRYGGSRLRRYGFPRERFLTKPYVPGNNVEYTPQTPRDFPKKFSRSSKLSRTPIDEHVTPTIGATTSYRSIFVTVDVHNFSRTLIIIIPRRTAARDRVFQIIRGASVSFALYVFREEND